MFNSIDKVFKLCEKLIEHKGIVGQSFPCCESHVVLSEANIELYNMEKHIRDLNDEIVLLINTWNSTSKQQFLDTWSLRVNRLKNLTDLTELNSKE